MMELVSESGDSLKHEECHDLNNYKNRVRRPPNAFMIFGQQFRKVLATKFENLNNKEISKLLGDEWRKMDGQTKSHYHSLAEETHRKHLEKYPGYYYSPLEARQRKAERKRKMKTSKSGQFMDDIHQTNNGSIVNPFVGNRPYLFRNPMYAMNRPMFGPPFHPRMGFGQQFCCIRPNYSFGGLVPFRPFPIRQPFGQIIKNECIDGVLSPQQFYTQNIRKEVEIVNNDSETQMSESIESTDIGLLSSLLPPMHNPNNEVTPVLHNQYFMSNQNSTNDNEVTKMSNAIVEQEFVLSEDFRKDMAKQDLQPVHIQSKVLGPLN